MYRILASRTEAAMFIYWNYGMKAAADWLRRNPREPGRYFYAVSRTISGQTHFKRKIDAENFRRLVEQVVVSYRARLRKTVMTCKLVIEKII